MNKRSIYIPSTSDIKILETVQSLNKDNLYPLPLGVYKILAGSVEKEFIKYKDLILISIGIIISIRRATNSI